MNADSINVKNKLAKRLLNTLFYTDNNASLDDGFSVLNSTLCFDKIKQYSAWINQLNIHSVMIVSPPSIDALCVCYALVLTNKTYIPVHTSTSSELLHVYLQHYQVDLVLIHPQLAKQFDCEFKTKLTQDENRGFFYFLSQKKQDTFCWIPGIVFFTSGTTEQPKVVHYYYDTLDRYLSWCLDEFKLDSQDTLLFATELSFVASLRPLFVPTLAGANIRFMGSSSTNKLQLIVNAILKNKITVLNLTPTLFKIVLQHMKQSKSQHTLSSVRLVLLSGEPIDITIINHWFAQIKADTIFYNLYGATEYLVPFYKRINAPLQDNDRLHLGQLRAGSLYQLLPNATQGDELCVAGDLSTAYFDEELSQKNYLIINNRRFIKTNDFVKMHNNELYFCSRSQRIIKKYGQLINLDQIEYVLKKHLNTLEFITFLDEENKNKIYLVICGALRDEALLTQVKLNLKMHLPGYMHPNDYLFTKELPLTTSGKIDYLLIKKTHTQSQVHDVSDYFKRFFHNNKVNKEMRIVDLGLESIDYIEMTEAFLRLTGKWLDVSKIDDDVRISTITSCLVSLNLETLNLSNAVKLSPNVTQFFSYELNSPQVKNSSCFVASFLLKGTINIKRFEIAIADTLGNHFMLNSKLAMKDNDFFFVSTTKQSNFRFRTPIFFVKTALSKLKTSVHSDRLVTIYIQKKRMQYFLIMAYHHIALDGWSALLLREEIFRRYEGIHEIMPWKKADEIDCLNKVNQVSLNTDYTISELKARLLQINPDEYNRVDSFFTGRLQKQNTCFSIEKHAVDQFARKNKIGEFPYSVIFALLLHQIISQLAGVYKLSFYTSFSNRNLPIANIKQLIANFATGLPVFFDSTNLTSKELALQIKENFAIYFKSISYGTTTELRQNEIIGKKLLSLHERPYSLVYTYINKIVADNYIQTNYIDWNHSTSEINPGGSTAIGNIFLRVYNMGSQFVVTLNSQMNPGLHNSLLKNLSGLLCVKR